MPTYLLTHHPAFNLIEIFFLILPFEWWMERSRYERLNNYVMGIIYSPLLLLTAWTETREAHRIRLNRRLGEEDDDHLEEWEEASAEVDFENDGWAQQVADSTPNVEFEVAVLEVRELKEQVGELMKMVQALQEGQTTNGSQS
jgi:hypothetical protein